MTQFDKVRHIIIDIGEGVPFTVDSIVKKDGNLARVTVSSYMSKLKNAGALKKQEIGYVCEDLDRITFFGKCSSKDVQSQPTNPVTPIPTNGTGLDALKDMVESLDWLINEHIPALEAKNQKLNEENRSMYCFLNKFTGQLSKAKEIRMATAREEDDKEAIVN